MTKLSDRELNQDVSRTERAADPSICELLGQPTAEDIKFDPPRLGGGIFRPAALP